MQPQLPPVARVPIETLPSGAVSTPELTISTVRGVPVLYVRQPVMLLTTWDRMRWYGPEIGSVLVLAAAIWAVWVTWRVLRRPRKRGRVYCRSCNYEQVAPAVERTVGGVVWASENSRCSECGRRQRLAIGRSRWRRLGVPLVICLGLLVGGSVTLHSTLAPPAPWTGVPWPTAWVGRQMGSWAVARREPEQKGHAVTRWELPSGRSLGTLCTEHIRAMRNGMLSPDGKVFALITEEMNPWKCSLVFVDTESGARWEHEIASVVYSPAEMVGFSPDSKCLYVQRQWAASPSSQEVTLEAWDVAARSVRQMATVPVPYHSAAAGMEAGFSRYLVNAQGLWVLAVLNRTATPMTGVADITAFDGVSEHKYSIALPSDNWYEPRLSDSGMLELPLVGAKAGVSVDLATGATSPLVPLPPALARAPDGRFEIRAGPSAAAVIGRDGVQMASLTNPASPATTMWSPATISKDGRWFAAMVIWLKPGVKPGSTVGTDYRAEALVWDLSGIR